MKNKLKYSTISLLLVATCFLAMMLPAQLAQAEEGEGGPTCHGHTQPAAPNMPAGCIKPDDTCTPNPPPNPVWQRICCRPGYLDRCIVLEWRYQCCGSPISNWGFAWQELTLGVDTTCPSAGTNECIFGS